LSKFLYIGQCEYGSTSRKRFEVINELTGGKAQLINISLLISKENRIFRSIAWRLYLGPLIFKINRVINNYLIGDKNYFDFIWIDKGVFIYPSLLKKLKARTNTLIHYTPDTAFFENKSRHFIRGINLYTILITTKSFELVEYHKYVPQNRVILQSQGYDAKIHFPRTDFSNKSNSIIFIGLYEPYRGEIIDRLLLSGFSVVLGGFGWSKFLRKQKNRKNQIKFLGKKILNENYAKALSQSRFALGLLSKRFPELHTTRTFEIPACGTCLVTEENNEINSFFTNEECLKFYDINELITKLKHYSSNIYHLEVLTQKGTERVIKNELNYDIQIAKIFNIISN